MDKVKSDEGAYDAKSHASESECKAVGSDTQENPAQRQRCRMAFERSSRRQASCDDIACHADKKDEETGTGESPARSEKDANRRAYGERKIVGDSVPGDDAGRSLAAHAADAPHGGARGGHAFADAENQAAEHKAVDAEPEGVLEQSGKEKKESTGGAEEQTIADSLSWAARICHAPGTRATGKHGDVLNADQKPSYGG